jgi:hypothetical protein
LKLGRVRLEFDPSPFANGSFEQRLSINEGYVSFKANNDFEAKLWVDVFNTVIHVDIQSGTDIRVVAFYENWRYEDYHLRQGEQGIKTKLKSATPANGSNSTIIVGRGI